MFLLVNFESGLFKKEPKNQIKSGYNGEMNLRVCEIDTQCCHRWTIDIHMLSLPGTLTFIASAPKLMSCPAVSWL